MKITLNQIKAQFPCEDGFKKLLRSLKKTKTDNTGVSINQILESNGVPDALWVIDNLYQDKRKVQLMCADFAERVLYIWEDWAKDHAKEHFHTPRKVIELIRAAASQKEIADAADAAADAAYVAAAAAGAGGGGAAERQKQKEIILKYFD